MTDLLAAVVTVGEVLACSNPVAAYVEMDSLLGAFYASEEGVRTSVFEHLSAMEPAARRARTRASRSFAVVRSPSETIEDRSGALADGYKRLLEGPFRQFAWALLCLDRGSWQNPPTLGPLRHQLIAAGGARAVLAEVIISELRNGEAHETLVWDGFAEQFISEGVAISPHEVVLMSEQTLCIIAGFEAGFAVARYLSLPEKPPILPGRDEAGRMPVSKRVHAFFGTNQLHLQAASLNSRHAVFQVSRIILVLVNPCFQAILLSSRLLLETETFSVRSIEGDVEIVVGVDAVRANMSTWEFVVSNLDKIPLSTFLALNLDARRRHESDRVAVRSVAWIAVDDALDAIDGSPYFWDDEVRDEVDVRLCVVEQAVGCVVDFLGSNEPRLESVAHSVASLRKWLADARPAGLDVVESRDEMLRLRLQWENWGAVFRHPLVRDEGEPDPNESRPMLRHPPDSARFFQL